jgi:hypothetical protein
MRSAIVIGLAVASAAAATDAQQFDMAAIQKWNDAKVVHYRISGVYSGTVAIARGTDAQYAQAAVNDGFTVDVDLEMRHLETVGAPKFTNVKTTMTGVASPGMVKCPPPAPKGEFEFFEVTNVVAGTQSSLELQGTRTFPAIGLSNQWRSSRSRPTGSRSCSRPGTGPGRTRRRS